MDTSGARRELEGFVAEVTPLVAIGDNDTFRRSAASIERLLASGFAPAFVAADPQSITGGYLSGRLKIEMPAKRRRVAKTRAIVLEGASLNNLKEVTATIPLGVIVAVGAALLLGTMAIRRRRAGTDYTPEP